MRTPSARRNLRAVTGLSAALGFALMFASLPAAAQQWTPKQRAACEPDAMRLCNQYIPDVQRVSACMSAYRRYLSPACRAFYGGATERKVRKQACEGCGHLEGGKSLGLGTGTVQRISNELR